MNSAEITELLQQAWHALKRGDLTTAFDLATILSVQAPQLEEPWLMLGILADPSLSVRYFEKALAINPDSYRAKKGIEWTAQRAFQISQSYVEKELMLSDEKKLHKSETEESPKTHIDDASKTNTLERWLLIVFLAVNFILILLCCLTTSILFLMGM